VGPWVCGGEFPIGVGVFDLWVVLRVVKGRLSLVAFRFPVRAYFQQRGDNLGIRLLEKKNRLAPVWLTTIVSGGAKFRPLNRLFDAFSRGGPFLGQKRGLLEHRLRRFLLLVGRVTVFAQDALYKHAQLRPYVLA